MQDQLSIGASDTGDSSDGDFCRSGRVVDAEFCLPLDGVSLSRVGDASSRRIYTQDGKWFWRGASEEEIVFGKEGYGTKRYTLKSTPEIIKLLRSTIVGFQDKLSYEPKEAPVVYVHSVRGFRATLFRHGIQKGEIVDLGIHGPSIQHVPDRHFVKGGLAWNPTFTYRISGDALPGIYSLLLECEGQNGQSFAIPMAICTPKRLCGDSSKLLVLVNTMTWQAYNIWGGRSRYRNFEDGVIPSVRRTDAQSFLYTLKQLVKERLPWRAIHVLRHFKAQCDKMPPAWISKPLSVARPMSNCALEDMDPYEPFTNHLAAGEWRLLAWLEREHIPYEVATDDQLHRHPDILLNYKGVILSTHSEYWSKAMFNALRIAHCSHGLWIFNLSGNSIYREVEALLDGSIRCSGMIFGRVGQDETELLGCQYDANAFGTSAAYQWVAPRSHVLIKGCMLEPDGLFGKHSLNRNTTSKTHNYDPGRPDWGDNTNGLGLIGEGASGWETDKLVRQRKHQFQIVAKGRNVPYGADMLWREPTHPRGGLFSASSITFSASLLIDKVASQIVKNAFEISGVVNRQCRARNGIPK